MLVFAFAGVSEICVDSLVAQSGSTPSGFVYTGGVSGSTGINAYSINQTTGALTTATAVSTSGKIVSLAPHPSGKFLYALVSADSATSLVGFTIDAQTGGLAPMAGSPQASGGTSLAMMPNGEFIYVGGSGGKIQAFAIDAATGALIPASQSPIPGTAVAINPGGTYLYASGSATVAYSINQATGALSQVQSLPLPVCRRLAVSSGGRYLYGLEQGIRAWHIDSTSGLLTEVQGSPFVSTLNFESLAVHPSGSFVYAAAEGTDQGRFIYGFSIDGGTGALTATPHSPYAEPVMQGSNVRAFDLTAEPHGKYLYAAETYNGVAGYSINSITGELIAVSSAFNSPGAGNIASTATGPSNSAVPVSLSISPGTETLVTNKLGKQVQFTLSATYSDGSTHFLTSSASWSQGHLFSGAHL